MPKTAVKVSVKKSKVPAPVVTSAPQTPPVKKKRHCFRNCAIVFILLGMFSVGAAINVPKKIQVTPSDGQVLATLTPTPTAENLASVTTMTVKGKVIFYQTDPKVEEKSQYTKDCPEVELKLKTIGCYNNGRIFVMKMENKELRDAEYSIAAHEMLHAAYFKLTDREKERVNKLINAETKLIKTKEYRDTKSAYIKAGHDVTDEFHSRFGTQEYILSPELEAYYGRYFSNRKAIVDRHKRYIVAFSKREARLAKLNREITALVKQIDKVVADLNYYSRTNNADAYYALLPTYNSLLKKYKAKVAEWRKIYDELDILYKALDQDYIPTPKKKAAAFAQNGIF